MATKAPAKTTKPAPRPRSAARTASGSGRGEARAAGRGIKVRATRLGYYDDQRKRIGDVFIIRNGNEFSHNWMETVDGSTPTKQTTAQQALNRETHRVIRERAGTDAPVDVGGRGPDNDVDPLGD